MNGKSWGAGLARIQFGAILIVGGCGSDTANDTADAGGIMSASNSDTDGTGSMSGGPGMDTMQGTGSGSGMGTDDPSGATTMDEPGTTTDNADTTAAGLGEFLYLEVDPIDTIMELDLNMPGSQAFTVEAQYENDRIDVTDMVTWDVSNPTVGSMNGATLDVPGFPNNYFGSTILTATFSGEQGQAQVTVAAYDQTSDQPDFFFVLPYNDPAGPQTKPLTFSTDVKKLDVFFNMDTTTSMDGEITNLRDSLTTVVIPGIDAQVDDTQYGVGAFEDFPVDPYGETDCTYGAVGGPDQPFELFAEMTSDILSVQTAVNALAPLGDAIGCGGDPPESGIEALYQIATGDGLAGPGLTFVASNNSGIGGVGFRDDSMPVIVNITDAITHDPNSNACPGDGEQYTDAGVLAVTHGAAETVQALNEICARVIQVATTAGSSCSAQADGIEWNNATGAVVPPEAWNVAGHPPGCANGQCCTGLNGAGVSPDGSGMCPLTYLASSNGTGVDSSIVGGIEMVARYAVFDVTREWNGVTTDMDGVALPAGTNTADFIKSVVPASHGAVPVPGVPDPTLTATEFQGVVPDTDVTFDVEAYNDFVPQGADARLFVATIRILADNCGTLDERDVFILVPPEALPDPS
jgi:hypothetical protein